MTKNLWCLEVSVKVHISPSLERYVPGVIRVQRGVRQDRGSDDDYRQKQRKKGSFQESSP